MPTSTEPVMRKAAGPRGRSTDATAPCARSFRRVTPHADWEDVFITSVAQSPIEDSAALVQVFDDIATQIARGGLSPVQEKVYGLCSEMDRILAARAVAFERRGLDPRLPVTFLEGAPCIGGIFSGAQVIGIGPRSGRVQVEPIHHDGEPVGWEVRIPDHRMVYLTGVSGKEPGKTASVTEQGSRMFHHAAKLLAERGLDPQHIVRTWIYLPRILDWYGEFNCVRTAWFRETGIIGPDGRGVLPASTGIQGRRHRGEECFMDVLAVVSDGTSRSPAAQMHNIRQNEPSEYGSSFSRGMTLGIGEVPTLYVSGTASIDLQGRTVYHGDEQGQIVETLLGIADLLKAQGARLKDLCQATAYCKTISEYRVYRGIVEHFDLDDIPFLPVLADVCRHELLFEVDSVAVPGSADGRDGGVTLPRRDA